jgi:hypothetical protein
MLQGRVHEPDDLDQTLRDSAACVIRESEGLDHIYDMLGLDNVCEQCGLDPEEDDEDKLNDRGWLATENLGLICLSCAQKRSAAP